MADDRCDCHCGVSCHDARCGLAQSASICGVFLGGGTQISHKPGDRLFGGNDLWGVFHDGHYRVGLLSRPDRGLVQTLSTVRNQHGEDVMTMIGLGFFPLRAEESDPAGG